MVDGWLKGPRAEAIRPLHWPLEFPEVMGVGGADGFDAVVGNPPFIGGKKLTGALGQDYREYLVNRLAGGTRGHADLCAYFLLRNLSIAPGRRTGIIATNTIAQGDTREVGLDRAMAEEWTVYRAVKSLPWPGTAALEVSLLWLGKSLGGTENPVLDGQKVRGITANLDPKSRVSGKPYPLVANEAQSFIGSYVLGKGFLLNPCDAKSLIAKDPKNADVLFPYLNGEDLNQRPGAKASRWVINFHDWPEEKAATYPDVFAIAEREVKPVRQRKKENGAYALRKPLPERWWQYADKRPALVESMASLDRVIVIVIVSKYLVPIRVSSSQVLAHRLAVVTNLSSAKLATLSSVQHELWVRKWTSTLEGRINYSPTDVFDTFPFPTETARLATAGEGLEGHQITSMSARGLGLTDLYNLVHSKSEIASDIEVIRAAHMEVDQAMANAYGWTDLDLKHDFHDTPQGLRFSIAPDVRAEILDRLLELNHARYKEEVEKGLHTPEAKRRRAAARKAKAKARAAKRNSSDASEGFDDGALFAQPDALF
jgi:hypothetical protein